MNHQPPRPASTNHAPAERGLAPILGTFPSVRIALFGPRVLFAYLGAMNTLYLIGYMLAAIFPRPSATILEYDTAGAMLSVFGEVFSGVRDFAAHWAFFGATPSPLVAGGLVVFSLMCGHALATMSRPARRRPELVERLIQLPDVAADNGDQLGAVDAKDRAQRTRGDKIADVHAALSQLDAEWLAYTMDVTAYYLTKPVLRDADIPQTAAYQVALYELRERSEGLGDHSSDSQIQAAEKAADSALQAWAAADDHALTVGVSDRSPTERAALRRLHALIGQLGDPSTPKPMRDTIVEAMAREMDKLTTVPASREHLAALPALAGRNFDAIASGRSKQPTVER